MLLPTHRNFRMFSVALLVEVVLVVHAEVVIVVGHTSGGGGELVGVAVGCLVHHLVFELG